MNQQIDAAISDRVAAAIGHTTLRAITAEVRAAYLERQLVDLDTEVGKLQAEVATLREPVPQDGQPTGGPDPFEDLVI